MKSAFVLALSALIFAGCSSKSERGSDAASPVPAYDKADVSFRKGTQELGQLVVEDNDRGVTMIFSTAKIAKGSYVLKIEDSCTPAKKMRGAGKVEVGSFTTDTGSITSEFFLPALSLGDRYVSIANKSVSLNKNGKGGGLTPVSCGQIVKR